MIRPHGVGVSLRMGQPTSECRVHPLVRPAMRRPQSAGAVLPRLLPLFDPEHFDDFAKGIIDTKHVIYYLSFMAFGLFLTAKSVDSERWRG